MKKNLAVILRGQVRSWNNAKFSIFEAFKPYEEHFNIVYFFVTWDCTYFSIDTKSNITKFEFKNLSSIDVNSIKFDFEGKNLQLHILDYHKVKEFIKDISLPEEYHLISYVRYISGLLKQNYEIENNCYFDLVFEARPDLYLAQHKQEFFKEHQDINAPINDFVFGAKIEILPRKHEIKNAKVSNPNSLFVEDVFFISNGFTSDILTSEFAFLYNRRRDEMIKHLHPHNMLADHFLNFKLVNTTLPVIMFIKDAEIVRPLEYFNEPVNFFNPSEKTLDQVKRANQNFKDKKENLK